MGKPCRLGALTGAIISGALFVGSISSSVHAQSYPDKPIKVIMPFGPGGAGDVFLRSLVPELQKRLGQSVVIENKPGAFTLIGGQACAQSPADGYTLCMLPIDTTSLAPSLFEKLQFDPGKDFSPVSFLFFIGQGLVVHSSLGVNSVKELVELSKVKNDTLSYVAQASQITLFMEEFKRSTGASLRRVPYTSGGQATADLLSGHVPVGFFGITNVLQNIDTGQIRFLAVDGERRSPLLPDVPTLREAGYASSPVRAWFGLFAPGKTPRAIVERVHKEVQEVLQDDAFVRRTIASRGLEPWPMSLDEFTQFLARDRAEADKLVKSNGYRISQ